MEKGSIRPSPSQALIRLGMRPTAILINVTRGEIVHGDDLLTALGQGLLWGARASTSPIPSRLPAGCPLWTHPRVHTAGGSPRRADRAITVFCENLRPMQAGQPLL